MGRSKPPHLLELVAVLRRTPLAYQRSFESQKTLENIP